jgi:hypothetical protein
MKHFLNVVVKLVNMIRSLCLCYRQFQDFSQFMNAEYSDVVYYTKVKLLSVRNLWQLKKEIMKFLSDLGKK